MYRKILLILSIVFLTSGVSAQDQDHGLKVNDMAPDFTVVDHLNNEVTLSEFYEDGPVVLLFYRGGWCPYCTRQLKSYEDNLDTFDELGVSIIALSVDTPENAAQTVQEENIGFSIVSNPGANVVKDYDLVYYVPDDLNDKYLNEYNIDLEGASGRSDHLLPIPATFVIDNGKIVFASANIDYKTRVPVEDVLEFLAQYLQNG